WDPILRITSWPAVFNAAATGRIHDLHPTSHQRQIPLAPRAPSIHELVEGRAAGSKRASTPGTSPRAGGLSTGLQGWATEGSPQRVALEGLREARGGGSGNRIRPVKEAAATAPAAQ